MIYDDIYKQPLKKDKKEEEKEGGKNNNNRLTSLLQDYSIITLLINYVNTFETNLPQTLTTPPNPNFIIHNKYLSNTIYLYSYIHKY